MNSENVVASVILRDSLVLLPSWSYIPSSKRDHIRSCANEQGGNGSEDHCHYNYGCNGLRTVTNHPTPNMRIMLRILRILAKRYGEYLPCNFIIWTFV